MIFQQIAEYFSTSSPQYWQYVGEHLMLSLTALTIAFAIGFPLGILCAGHPQLRKIFVFGAQALRVIPSLAVLFILIPFWGVGTLPAITALIFLGLPPIIVNTLTGFNEVPAMMLEAGRGLGMDSWQLFKRVSFPLAIPYILSGIKLALVEIIASATLATYIGAGGLGTLIFTGLGLFRVDLLLIGGVSVAILSFSVTLLMDAIIKRSVTDK